MIDVLSIDSKQISGAGFTSPLLWTYSYGPANSSYAQQCTTSCPTTKNVTVTNPDGSWAIHTYSNKYNSAEGKELEVQIGKGGATSSTENKSYLLDPGGQPYPALIGQSPCNRCDPDGEIYQPLKSQTINQDGVNYTYTVNAFDVFARAVNVTKNNSLGYAKTEVTQYSDNFSSWVVGQIARTTANGIEVDRFDYDPTTALPIDYYRFGALKKNLSYNADGTLYQIKDGLGNTTTLSNWKRGIPQYATYADGAQESLSVDDSGNVTSVTDQMGSTTSYSYDSVGRVTQTTYPSGDEQPWYPAVYTYNFVNTAERGVAANHWRRTITKGTLSQTTLYDVFWRPILNDTSNVNDSSSHISSRIDYDWLGNKVFVSYPVSGAPDIGAISVGTNTSFDALNRPVSTQQTSELGTLTSSTTYLSGAKTQVTDPKGNITTTSYQSFDTPSYDEPILIQAPAGITQTITRDIFGSATAITQSGAYGNETDSVTKTLVYDANHRLCRTIEPESGSTVVAYDAADNVVWSAMGQNITGSDCGQDQVATSARTIRTYDAINRVKTVTPPVGTQATTYSYDQLGNLYSAVSGTSVWMASHNKLGQLTREALQVNGQNPWTIGYQHDGYGSLNVITYPDGETATYAPDAMGRATQVSGYASGVTYFPNGQVAGFNFGNGASYVAEQNARQLLSNFSYGIGSTLALSEDYSYDADSNITKVSDIVNGQRTKTFSYDTLNRLTGATANNLYGTENYTYDPLNNLRSRLTAGTTLTFNYDAANHLANVMQDGSVTTSFGYDVQGNRASLSSGGVTKQYLFDAENQLLQIPGLEGYGYDAAGRRVSKTPNDRAPTYYFYNQSGQLLYQWDSAVGTSTNFFYLGTKLVAKDALAGGVNTGSTGVSVLFPPSYSSTGYYTVSWYNITGASSYELQSVVNGVWTTIYVGSTNGYDISGAASGIYQYRVRACASTGNCGAWSAPAEVTVNTQAPSPTPALAPLLMVNRSGIPANYTVLWTGVDKAATYNLQEQYKGGAWATVYSGSNGSWNATNKPIGGYAYQVQACNGAGCGPWCPAVTIQVIVDMSPIINLILDDN
ncbi:hypothetical protein [Dyella sp.]|uniref:RHS repeat domain-containing protein n=1 Tax=Dyella sp. TaxID=1869338 RepID=UPI002D7723A9|nr:hypothetical protein [Dyella sp.]HET7332008.1 hypothetical protein [Dyella sp.]